MGSRPHNSFKSPFNNLLHLTFQPTAIPPLSPILQLLHTPSIPFDHSGASQLFVQYRLTGFTIIRFLKTKVLPALAEASEIKMVKQPCLTPVERRLNVKGRDPNFEFLWKVVDLNDPSSPPQRSKPKKEVIAKKDGVNLDYNNRRQNDSIGKNSRNIEATKSFQPTWGQDQTSANDRRR
jgi:hypothetical protein